MTPIFFSSPSEFGKWLEKNHETEKEILVGFYKVSSARQNMTWSQSVDTALCFGWIDGVRKSIDEISYCIRFTPRRKNSNWSLINIRKVEELTKKGLMRPAGLDAFNNRKEEKLPLNSLENEITELPKDLANLFRANKKAWEFFSKQAPSYQKTIINWINSAKQKHKQMARMGKAITESENGSRLWKSKKGQSQRSSRAVERSLKSHPSEINENN